MTARATIKAAAAASSHYGDILKSSAVIGGSSALVVGIGLLRTKALAVLLGPGGFGLMGLYASIVDVATSLAAVGINSSGVRQIADAAATGDETRIARTITALRCTSLILAITGAAALALLSSKVATWTFGNDVHAAAVSLLGLAVLFRILADTRGAMIQGLRRVADLARMNVTGSLLGSVLAVSVVWAVGDAGVAAALAATASASLAAAWWYSRRLGPARAVVTMHEMRHEARLLLGLGVAFMASAFLMMGSAYCVRLILVNTSGLEAAGLYQAAWTLGGLYITFILQAMGADFYPRLVGVANDAERCNRAVNEQAHVSLLLAGPGVVATVTFASLVLSAFYTSEFQAAVDVLRWICLGMMLRVITWPIGFVILAKGRQVVFLATEIAWTVVHVGLSWILVERFGLAGAGIAFFASYIVHGLMIYPIVRAMSGFRWSPENLKTASIDLTLIGAVLCSFHLAPAWFAFALGTSVSIGMAAHTLRRLSSLVPAGPWRQMIMRAPLRRRPHAMEDRRER